MNLTPSTSSASVVSIPKSKNQFGGLIFFESIVNDAQSFECTFSVVSDDIDKRLFELLMPTFGKGTKLTIDRMDGSVVERPLPEHIWDALGDWQTIEEMKRTDTVSFIKEAARPGNSTNPQAMNALHELISRNLYFSLLQEPKRGSNSCATESHTTTPVSRVRGDSSPSVSAKEART